MKMITRRGLFLLILIVAFLGGLGFLSYSMFTQGDKWVMQPYNNRLYYNGELIGAGTITDRNGVTLAETAKEYTASQKLQEKAHCILLVTLSALFQQVFRRSINQSSQAIIP